MPFLSRGPSGPTQRHSQNPVGGTATRRRGGRLPGGDSRHVPRGNKIPGESRRRPRQAVPSTDESPGYDKKQVDAFLDAAGIRLAAMESTDRPAGPLVSGAILAKWADSTRFSTSRLRVGRYDTAEVDAFRDAIRDTFLGVGGSPLTWRAPPGKQFTTTRRLRPGYDPEQVDAFLDKAERKLAAMESTDRARRTTG